MFSLVARFAEVPLLSSRPFPSLLLPSPSLTPLVAPPPKPPRFISAAAATRPSPRRFTTNVKEDSRGQRLPPLIKNYRYHQLENRKEEKEPDQHDLEGGDSETEEEPSIVIPAGKAASDMDIAISFAQPKGQHRYENLEFVQRDVGQAHLLWMEFCGKSARHQKAGAMAILTEGDSPLALCGRYCFGQLLRGRRLQ